jgi:hypothetical protein
MAVTLVDEYLTGTSFPKLDLSALFKEGVLCKVGDPRIDAPFLQIPPEYEKYLPPVFRVHSWDQACFSPVVDTDGLCYLVLMNDDRDLAKPRESEFDGLQAIVEAIWDEGRVDLFDLPICCVVQYMCFRVIISPMELWMEGEESYRRFLDSEIVGDPVKLAAWQNANAEVSSVLQDVAKHIRNNLTKYPIGFSSTSESVGGLWLSVNRQKLSLYCPRLDLMVSPQHFSPNLDKINELAMKIKNMECLAISPIVIRAMLRDHEVRVRHSGLILQALDLPIFKQIVVRDMLSRAAKWAIRRELGAAVREMRPLPSINLAQLWCDRESELCEEASAYFNVPISEIDPYLPTNLDPYVARYYDDLDFSTSDNQALFPHASLLNVNRTGFFPVSKFVAPRPKPELSTDDHGNALESLPVKYAAKIYELELNIGSGDLVEAVVSISDLVETVIGMRAIDPVESSREQMKLKILALCEAARALQPACLPLPVQIIHSILRMTPSVILYRAFRNELVRSEGSDSISLLPFDSFMASLIHSSDAELAETILTLVIQRSERMLGLRHPVTVSAYIRKAQTIKSVLELPAPSDDIKHRQSLIHEGVRCLSRAVAALKAETRANVITADQLSVAYQLLAIFHTWNGESKKAVAVSREGMDSIQQFFGSLHPRYLNSAFLHARLLEDLAASITLPPTDAVHVAREAVEILEDLLTRLQDLANIDCLDQSTLNEFTHLLGPGFDNSEADMKRKIAVTAMLLKLNVWLLDSALASDILDLVVAHRVSGSRGVLHLPHRQAVKDFVRKTLSESLQNFHSAKNALPKVELTGPLTDSVLKCCKLALIANSRGSSITAWFKAFTDDTLRGMGDSDASATNRDLLTSLFMQFVFVTSHADGVYVGPISQPLMPRKLAAETRSSQGVIYRDWALSATLYCLDHDVVDLSNARMSS